MKINISNRNLKKKHERGLQEQRKKKTWMEVIKGGRNLTVLMLGIEKQFSTQTGEMQRFKWQNVTLEVGRTRFKKAVKKIKNLFHEQRCGLRNWTETFRLKFDWIQEVAC